MLLGRERPDAAGLVALEAIQRWTRRRFKLGSESIVLVSEVICRLAGCPPLETVVAFWTQDETRHQFKLYKPVADVKYDDIGWLIGLPTNHDGAAWDCC